MAQAAQTADRMSRMEAPGAKTMLRARLGTEQAQQNYQAQKSQAAQVIEMLSGRRVAEAMDPPSRRRLPPARLYFANSPTLYPQCFQRRRPRYFPASPKARYCPVRKPQASRRSRKAQPPTPA